MKRNQIDGLSNHPWLNYADLGGFPSQTNDYEHSV